MENFVYLIQNLRKRYELEHQEDINKTLILVRFQKHREDAEDYVDVLFQRCLHPQLSIIQISVN